MISVLRSFLSTDKLAPLLVFAFFLAFFSASLGNRPVFTRGEGREAMAVKNMYEQGNYILPLIDGEKIPSKPPLFHWLATLTSSLEGQLNEFTLRFPSALSAALLLSALYIFGSHYLPQSFSLLAVLILASSFEFARSATHARVDMCFASGISIALLSLFHAIQLTGKQRWSFSILSSFAASAAVLAKGPSALGILALVYASFKLVTLRNKREQIRGEYFQVLCVLMLAGSIAGLWYFLAYLGNGGEFLLRQIWEENVTRFFNISGETDLRGHVKPFYFGVLNLLLGFLPWSLLAPPLLVWLWQRAGVSGEEERDLESFSICWLLVVLIAVSFSQSKRVVYLLPAYPAVALLLSMLLHRKYFRRDTAERNALRISALLMWVLTIGVTLVVLIGASMLLAEAGEEYAHFFGGTPERTDFIYGVLEFVRTHRLLLILLSGVAVILAISSRELWRIHTLRATYLLGVGMLLGIFGYGASLYPGVSEYRDSRELVRVAEAVLSEKEMPIEIFRANLYAERFYSSRPLPFVLTAGELVGRGGGLVILERKNLELLQETVGEVEILYEGKQSPVKPSAGLLLVRYRK